MPNSSRWIDLLPKTPFTENVSVAVELLENVMPPVPTDPFANNAPFPGSRIPANRIDPTAARIMQYVWAPNNPGQNLAGLNNYAKNYGVQGKYVNFLNRTDWNVSDKLRLYGRVNATEATFAQSDFCRSDLQAVVPTAKTCIGRSL